MTKLWNAPITRVGVSGVTPICAATRRLTTDRLAPESSSASSALSFSFTGTRIPGFSLSIARLITSAVPRAQ